MKRNYKDWTIVLEKTFDYAYGEGFCATAYIAKTDGTKTNIREFYRFDGIKTHKQMLEYTQKLLEV